MAVYLHNTLKLVPSLAQLNIQDKVLAEVELPPKGLVFHIFFLSKMTCCDLQAKLCWREVAPIILCPLRLSLTLSHVECLCNIYVPYKMAHPYPGKWHQMVKYLKCSSCYSLVGMPGI